MMQNKNKKPRICRMCGGEAMEASKKQGLICQSCYNLWYLEHKQREKEKQRAAVHWNECKYCSGKTKSLAGVCNQCLRKIDKGSIAAIREFPDYDFSKESEIKRWNEDHPIRPQRIENLHIAFQTLYDDYQRL